MGLFSKPSPSTWPEGLPPLAVREHRGRHEILDEYGVVWTDRDNALANHGIHLLWAAGWFSYYEEDATRSNNAPGSMA